jgi:hypothetical protein
MDILLWRPGVADLGEEKHAKQAAELKCRFALNSMPQGYGWGKGSAANPAERTDVL